MCDMKKHVSSKGRVLQSVDKSEEVKISDKEKERGHSRPIPSRAFLLCMLAIVLPLIHIQGQRCTRFHLPN